MSASRCLIRGHRTIATVSLVATALICSGCGTDPDRKWPVTGRVLLNGQPLTKGEVVLIPDEEAGNRRLECPMAEIQPDGTYTVALRNEGGAAIGPYKVMVMATSNPVEVRPGWVPKWIVHPKYTQRATTDLRIIVVDEPAPGAYDLRVEPPPQ